MKNLSLQEKLNLLDDKSLEKNDLLYEILSDLAQKATNLEAKAADSEAKAAYHLESLREMSKEIEELQIKVASLRPNLE